MGWFITSRGVHPHPQNNESVFFIVIGGPSLPPSAAPFDIRKAGRTGVLQLLALLLLDQGLKWGW